MQENLKNVAGVSSQNNLREEFNALTNVEQQTVANYLNLHNACVFYYETILSDSCKQFVQHAYSVSEEVENMKSVPEDELDS